MVKTAVRLIVLLCLLPLVVQLQAQNQEIYLTTSELTVRQAISELEKQTGKRFGFSSVLDLSRVIRVDRPEVSFGELFDKILGTDFKFAEDGNYILIYPVSLEEKPVMGFISGRIVNGQTGEPAAGAAVLVFGVESGNISLAANASGYFQSEEVPEGNYIVRFSSPDGKTVLYREMAAAETIRFRTTIRLEDFLCDDREVEPKRLLTIEPAKQTFASYLPVLDEKRPGFVPEEPSAGYRDFAPPASRYRPGVSQLAVKTNALWWALGALNAEGEFRLRDKWTATLFAAYSPWESGEKKQRFWIVQPEVRYWLCQAFERHSLGIYASFGGYDVGKLDLPFPTLLDDEYLDGYLFGGGVSYSYHMPLGKRWGLEFSAGIGFLRLKYDQYSDGLDGGVTKKDNRYYVGPTKAGISLIYIIR